MGQRYSELVKARRLGSAFIGPDNRIVDPGQTTRSFSPSMANFPTEFNEKKSVKSKLGPKRSKEDDGYPCTKCNRSYSRLYQTIIHLKKGKRNPQNTFQNWIGDKELFGHPNVPYPYGVNWQLVIENGSLTPICSYHNVPCHQVWLYIKCAWWSHV